MVYVRVVVPENFFTGYNREYRILLRLKLCTNFDH